MGRVGWVACGIVVLASGAFVLKEPPAGSIGAEMAANRAAAQHSDCWYHMSPAVRGYGGTEAERSDIKDQMCEQARTLSGNSELSYAQAEKLVASMTLAPKPTLVTQPVVVPVPAPKAPSVAAHHKPNDHRQVSASK